MHCLVERGPLLVAVKTASKLITPDCYSGPTCGRVVLRHHQQHLLHVASTNVTTHLDFYIPANFENTDRPIATKSKEWAYLLKNMVDTPLVSIMSQMIDGMATNTAMVNNAQFPDEGDIDWEDHELEPSSPLAIVRIDALQRALQVSKDFSSRNLEVRCFGVHIEAVLGAGLRFVATNGHCMSLFDMQNGLYSMNDEQMPVFIEYPCVSTVLACLDLWEGVDPNEVDCEIRVVKRTHTHEDGEVRELFPVVIFDIAGCGYRARITTAMPSSFVDFRQVLKGADESFIEVTTQRVALQELCEWAVKQSGRKKSKVVFKFLPEAPSAAGYIGLSVGYASDKRDAAKVPLTRRDLVPYQLPSATRVVNGGLAQPAEGFESPDTNIITVDADYVLDMLRHLHDEEVVLRFHGMVDLIEVLGTSTVDPCYFVCMPIYQQVEEDAL